MFAELVINIEAGLESNFHYDVPRDMQKKLRVGHLVEVEFGRRLAQGIILSFDDEAPVDDTKPIISLIDERPVLRPWQIELGRWMSQQFLAPLNSCLRLMLPPGLTRWSDITVDINPYWDGNGRLTELQKEILELLEKKGDMRGRQLQRALPKTSWKTAVNQLVKRDILRRASVLDPPRAKPKKIRTVTLIANEKRVRDALLTLGRKNKKADLLTHLLQSDDPMLEETAVLDQTGASSSHLKALVKEGLINQNPAYTLLVPTKQTASAPAEFQNILQQLPLPESKLSIDNQQSTIDNLLSQNFVQKIEYPNSLSLANSYQETRQQVSELRGATIYQAVIDELIKAAQPVELSDLYATTNASLSHLKRLVKLDLIQFGSEEVWRDPLADRDFVPAEAPLLTKDQARAWGRVKMQMVNLDPEEPDDSEDENGTIAPFLLHGVTGSGKTEIYMRAIAFALERGQQAIVLVPEIALTPQTVRRFAARFPGRVAVLHSRLTDGERYDTWRRARQGLFDIVVGPRSALFSPLPNLGVIVVDEEHDGSYKQTPPVPPPYYHARDVAIQMGQLLRATVILGSATPDIVSYHRAQSGRYQLLELPKRVMGHRQRVESQSERLNTPSIYMHEAEDPEDALTIPLPPIQIVDLRQELRAGNRSIFSRALETAVTQTLERNEQAILFLNRRGSATFVICRDCGYVANCPRCDSPLTYHRPHMSLVCHHCGRQEPNHAECPQCSSKRIRYFGLGTEEVEARVQARWPDARITRWDRDTTAGKNKHENLLASFINQEADILVGTQMIAKGLDLPLVTLVGVISADVSLGLPDYRTGERAFQVLAQVAGRAGRGLLGGRVIVQTYQPEHYAIQAAADHDYTSFYIDEIRFRTQHSLPPFRRMAKLVLVDPVSERAKQQAEDLARGLRLHIRQQALAASEVIGPTPPFFGRVDGRYRWQIIIRSPNPNRLLEDFPIPPKWQVDIDPVSTL